jgi:hypothetical protein
MKNLNNKLKKNIININRLKIIKMPILHDLNNRWIYKAIIENKFTYDVNISAYRYKNPAFPEKNYKKIFNPSEYMSRGDVINFGGSYRNENRMIFDGSKLVPLYTEVDDYGSVPPDFVAGDAIDEFKIGDFQESIEHNTINWLSKNKLKEIEVYEKNNVIMGDVTIKGKKYEIIFNIYNQSEFIKRAMWISKEYKCDIEHDQIVINKLNPISLYSKKYLIKPVNISDNDNLINLVTSNTTRIISGKNNWFLFTPVKEYKIKDENTRNFPLIWKKVTGYLSEILILNQEEYDYYLSISKYIVHSNNPADNTINPMDNIYIIEITGYPIIIELLEKDTHTLINQVKEYISDKIEKYEILSERIPFNLIDDMLEVNL